MGTRIPTPSGGYFRGRSLVAASKASSRGRHGAPQPDGAAELPLPRPPLPAHAGRRQVPGRSARLPASQCFAPNAHEVSEPGTDDDRPGLLHALRARSGRRRECTPPAPGHATASGPIRVARKTCEVLRWRALAVRRFGARSDSVSQLTSQSAPYPKRTTVPPVKADTDSDSGSTMAQWHHGTHGSGRADSPPGRRHVCTGVTFSRRAPTSSLPHHPRFGDRPGWSRR